MHASPEFSHLDITHMEISHLDISHLDFSQPRHLLPGLFTCLDNSHLGIFPFRSKKKFDKKIVIFVYLECSKI